MIPDELSGSVKVETATKEDLQTREALTAFLAKYGLDQGSTQDADELWKEIKRDEAGLEIWGNSSRGVLRPVRMVHILRAKVSSPEAYKRRTFLINSWQQYADGRKLTSNGLFSMKVSVEEMPFEDHIHEICERAAMNEVIRRLGESTLRNGSHSYAPNDYSGYLLPLKVEEEHLVHRKVEFESSSSYPGLVTLYHLYTVDLICTGLPSLDFNTLETDMENVHGERRLKCIYAWVWLGWPQIQRFLLERSVRKEKKSQRSFQNIDAFRSWLDQFGFDLDSWDEGKVEDLFDELRRQACSLELWDRHDGAPLLIRVVHVLQAKLRSSDPRLFGKHLMHMWTQRPEGKVITQHRLFSRKVDPITCEDDQLIEKFAAQSIAEQFEHLSDAHHDNREVPSSASDCERSNVHVAKAWKLGEHYDIEESSSFIGVFTKYHIYTVEAICEKLPDADFTSLDSMYGQPVVHGWHWTTWYETMDIYNATKQGTMRRDAQRGTVVGRSTKQLADLETAVRRLTSKLPREASTAEEVRSHLELLRSLLTDLQASFNQGDRDSASAFLPACMISKIAAESSCKHAEGMEEQRLTPPFSRLPDEGDQPDAGFACGPVKVRPPDCERCCSIRSMWSS